MLLLRVCALILPYPQPTRIIMVNVAELSVPGSNSKIRVCTGLFINNEFVPSVENLDRIT